MRVSLFCKKYEAVFNIIIGFLTVLIGTVGIFKVSDAIKITRNINANNSIVSELCVIYGTEDKTLASSLYEAQKNYKAGYYSQAIEILTRYADESSIACNNLGYMYSNGLGTKQNFDTACTYYKKAYENGFSIGLENYLAINLQSPRSYTDISKSLKYGIEHNYTRAMLFAAYFETGKMYVDYSDMVFEYAVDFVNRPQYEQNTKMEQKKYISEVYLEKTYAESLPDSTDFITYNKTDIKSYEVLDDYLISELEYTDKGNYIELNTPVVNFKEVYFYQVSKYSIHCAFDLMQEQFYEAVVNN